MACKSNEKRIRSYSRSSGVKVKSHCRVTRKCSRGKKYRKSYTRKSGTRVKGHCVSSRRSSRRRVSRKTSRSRPSSRPSTSSSRPSTSSSRPSTSSSRPSTSSSSRQSYSRQEQPYSKTFEKSYKPSSMGGISLSKQQQKQQERPDYERKYDEEAQPSYFSEMQKEACVKLFQKYGLWSNKLDEFKKNFRQWSLRNHPDKNPEMADIYSQVSSCYKDTLKHVWNVSF